jgi:hypothetical protein
LQCERGNSFETNGWIARRTCGMSIRSTPSAVSRFSERASYRRAVVQTPR